VDCGEVELLEKIFGLLRIRHVTPLVFSQQFKVQHSLPEKIFSVTGCWRCSFIFPVEATPQGSGSVWRCEYVPQLFFVKSGKPYSLSSCRCPLAFSPSCHSRRPHGKFTRSTGLFHLHPNGPNRLRFCDHGKATSLGLHHQF